MKVLLDECLPVDFLRSFSGHEVHTAEWTGLKGKGNGELLRCAELAGYDVLLTVDNGMPQQQNLAGRKLSIVVVRAPTNQIEDLLPLLDAKLTALKTIMAGQVVVVG